MVYVLHLRRVLQCFLPMSGPPALWTLALYHYKQMENTQKGMKCNKSNDLKSYSDILKRGKYSTLLKIKVLKSLFTDAIEEPFLVVPQRTFD